MMKRIILALLILFFVGDAFAQITILNADMPKANDTVRVTTATGNVDVKLTGADYNWNFADLMPNNQEVIKHLSPLQTPFILYFSGATYGLPEANANVGALALQEPYGFYKTSNAALVFMGRGASVQNLPIGISYNPRDTIYRFPLTYLRKDSANFAGEVTLAGLGSLKIGGKRVVEVDGWGSITTPFGTFNCIRVKSVITETDTLVVGGFPLPVPNNRIEYKWLAKGLKFPVLEVITTTGFPSTTTIRFIDRYRPELYVNNARFMANKTKTQMGDTLNLIDQSINNPTDWFYTITPNTYRFVDGTSATSQNPRVVFDANGLYTIKLKTTHNGGTDDTLRLNYISVEPGVIANFGVDRNITDPATVVNFYDSSSGNPTSYLWSFIPNTISYVGGTSAVSKNPKVVFNNSGSYAVTLIATGNVGSNSITKSNFIQVWPTGINTNIGLENHFVISPNPVYNNLNITSTLNLSSFSLSVFDVLGKTYSVNFEHNNNQIMANLQGLPSGVYYLHLTNNQQSVNLKFIKE